MSLHLFSSLPQRNTASSLSGTSLPRCYTIKIIFCVFSSHVARGGAGGSGGCGSGGGGVAAARQSCRVHGGAV